MAKADTKKTGVTGKSLARRYNVQSLYSLYRKSGDWYHVLRQFPGALLDQDGYLLFAREEEFRSCPGLKIFDESNTVTVLSRISDICDSCLISIPSILKKHLNHQIW